MRAAKSMPKVWQGNIRSALAIEQQVTSTAGNGLRWTTSEADKGRRIDENTLSVQMATQWLNKANQTRPLLARTFVLFIDELEFELIMASDRHV